MSNLPPWLVLPLCPTCPSSRGLAITHRPSTPIVLYHTSAHHPTHEGDRPLPATFRLHKLTILFLNRPFIKRTFPTRTGRPSAGLLSFSIIIHSQHRTLTRNAPAATLHRLEPHPSLRRHPSLSNPVTTPPVNNIPISRRWPPPHFPTTTRVTRSHRLVCPSWLPPSKPPHKLALPIPSLPSKMASPPLNLPARVLPCTPFGIKTTTYAPHLS